MITGITVENFKGIRESQEIELRPLTLLFGANSAGKSSFLHALQYAAEVFEGRNLNAGLIGNGAAGVDLGGYQNFVHRHNQNLDVVLAFRLAFEEAQSFPNFSTRTPRDVDEPSSLYGFAKSARVALSIGWSNVLAAPFVRRYAVALNETNLAEINYEPGGVDCTLFLNDLHPIFAQGSEHSALTLWHPLQSQDLAEFGEGTIISHLLSWARQTRAIAGIGPCKKEPYTSWYGVFEQRDALPSFDLPLSFDGDWDWADRDPQLQTARIPELADYLTEAISQVVLGPGRILREQLAQSRFLGPIREVPPRNHIPSRQQERGRWSSGLGAWDRLETSDDAFVDSVSHWLGDEDRLNSGYRLRLKRYKELDLSNPLVVLLQTSRAFDEAEADARIDLSKLPTQSRLLILPTDESVELRPSDVGIGISQVVPVIVTALDGEGRTIAIEQPELHLHPKLQAELGDLFIESAKGKTRHFVFLETHSELIPLRLMRRIKETIEQRKEQTHPHLTADDVAIYYVATFKGATVVTRLNLSESGQLLDPWPEGFFEEGYRERFAD